MKIIENIKKSFCLSKLYLIFTILEIDFEVYILKWLKKNICVKIILSEKKAQFSTLLL